jgi:hypothetical protein
MTRRRKRPPTLSEIRSFSGRRYLRPKYPPRTDAVMAAEPEPPELSPADAKTLAFLVRKYGREKIALAAWSLVTRGPGHPSRGLLPYYERMHEADWLEEVAEERRKAGSRKRYVDAATELYEMKFGTPQRDKDGKLRYLTCYDDHGNPVYGKAPKPASFLSTIKKKRQRGRRELQEVREALARRDAYFKKLRMNSRGRK